MTVTAYAGAFNQVGQQRKNRRRIALGRRRLTNGQTNFTLRMGHASQAVDQHQNIQTLIAEILCNHMGHVRRF